MNTTTTAAANPTIEPPSSDQRVEQALARIQASRASMRRVLMPQPKPQPAHYADVPEGERSGWSRRFAEGWQRWRQAMADNPAVSVGMDAAQGWWKRQPLRPAVETAAGELRSVVTPFVRSHPVLAVAAAAAIGAALVIGRPWRWPTLNKHLADAPQRASRWVWTQLTQAPVQSLLASFFVAWIAGRKLDPGSAADAAADAAADVDTAAAAAAAADAAAARPPPAHPEREAAPAAMQ